MDITEMKVREIIADKLGVEKEEITLESRFREDLGADSLDTVEMLMECEKEFSIAMKDEDTEKITTVGEVITYIQNLKK